MGFTIATYNVKDLFDETAPALREDRTLGRYVYRAKLEAIAPMIRRVDADIIALQEVSSQRVLDDLAKMLSRDTGANYIATRVATADERGIACGLLSRFEVSSVCDHRPADLPPIRFRSDEPRMSAEGSVYAHRGMLETRIALPDRSTLVLINVHFKSNLPIPMLNVEGQGVPFADHHAHGEGLARAMITRVSEALYVRKLIDALLAKDPWTQLAVVGDFNDNEHSVSVRALMGDPMLGSVQSGNDAFAGRSLFSCTRGIPHESRYSVVFRGEPSQIDHILVSRGLWARFGSAKFYNETLREDLAAQGPGGVGSLASDHAPLRADFR
ncbi:MAG: endonuclease/exonuclease/phosphatase family protein [Deltaproteobacteria bacterium]|nr:endonuclease/exonuclease/phosphatase family protein [Deltaproteobacteria bacterium]